MPGDSNLNIDFNAFDGRNAQNYVDRISKQTEILS